MYIRKTKSWVKHTDFILLDVICLQLAFVFAYMVRHGFKVPYFDINYLNLAIVYALVDFAALVGNRNMKNVLKRGFYKELAKTVNNALLVMVLMSLYMFSVKLGATYSRIAFFLVFAFYVPLSYCGRVILKKIIRHKKRDEIRSAIYLVTTENRAERVVRRFRDTDLDGNKIQGLCILDKDCVGQSIDGIPVLASADTLVKHLCEVWVDEILFSLPDSYPYPAELVAKITEMGIVVHQELERVADLWQHEIIQKYGGTTVRTISMTLATPIEAFMKRTLDIMGGLVGCVITLLLTIVIGPIIYINSPGPIFFAQTRVGKNGRKFKMYKFRSMYMDAEERKAELMAQNRVGGGLMFKLDYDPRIIGSKKLPDGTVKKGIGNFIRDYSLDEFPQFFNVLKGDLSLCGTRPPTVDEWEKYELHHHARLAIKPGITGMWQVSGRSNITDFEQVVELDKKYIREWSMGLDFRILLQTVKAVFKKDGSM